MGECIISRASIPGEAETIVPITPGYHTILVTVRDYKGGLMKNYPINCTDGSSVYNYTTNEKGQALFVTNSGAANIYATNSFNGYTYIDFDCQWKNIDAPVGLTTKANINLLQNTVSKREYLNAGNYSLAVRSPHLISNIIIVGGGGGGGGHASYSGGGGGAGYLNTLSEFYMNDRLNIRVGSGGSGGSNSNGNSGGTTTFSNILSAAGGGGGDQSGENIAIGGLGNGGLPYNRGENSPVTYAGGGGGGSSGSKAWFPGGSPYGGRGYGYSGAYAATSGSRGGGGGGGGFGTGVDDATWKGGKGGNGIVLFNINIIS